MPYLICPQCDHYYEVEPGEEFTQCECGQALISVENLDEYYSSPQRESIATGNTFTEEMAHQYHDNYEKGKNLKIIGMTVAIVGFLLTLFFREFLFLIFVLLGTAVLIYAYSFSSMIEVKDKG
jgi:hypothetical protein